MSGETGEHRDWRFYVNDMIEFVEIVLVQHQTDLH